ncbi:Serine/threonine-protein [Carex littledalei]|uniref:Serine/threonine-protein n=1 Tax=Carex littledalei TaxID=544730 RepID=A0A833RJG2_9POAL|nr:Serine/threonine-protein [Carex littledalei]
MAFRNMSVDRTAQFVLMLDALSTEQKQKISDLGFGCLFKLQPILVNRSLIGTLSKVYQPDTQTFTIGEKNLSLTTWDAYCIMGLRDEGIHIDFERKAPNEALIDIFENPITQNISFCELKSRISTFDATDENFVRVFVVLMITGLLAQPTDDRIPWEYVNIVENVDQIPNFNWAEFTVSFLHRSLTQSKSTKMRLEGNFILLQLWYYEHVQDITVNNNLDHHHPLMSKWTRELMEKREEYERRHGRFNGNIVQRLNLSEIQLDCNNVGESLELKIISREQWISTHPKTKMKNESLQQLPIKTPEKMIEKKNTRVNMISDHSEEEGGQHKSKRIKQSRLKEQERNTYGFIQADKDISRVRLGKNEMAAVEYVRNVESSTEVVKMNGAFGTLTLTAGDMNCLIQPTYETGHSKWINDEVDDEDAELFRKRLVYQLIMNEKNTLEKVQKDIWDRVLSPEEYK